MNIKRDKYLNDLINRMHNGMIKVVTGIGRCGKSYLIFTTIRSQQLAKICYNLPSNRIFEEKQNYPEMP